MQEAISKALPKIVGLIAAEAQAPPHYVEDWMALREPLILPNMPVDFEAHFVKRQQNHQDQKSLRPLLHLHQGIDVPLVEVLVLPFLRLHLRSLRR